MASLPPNEEAEPLVVLAAKEAEAVPAEERNGTAALAVLGSGGCLDCSLLHGQLNLSYAASLDAPSAPLGGSLHCGLLNGHLSLSYAASPDKPFAPRGGSLHRGLLIGHRSLSYAASLDAPSAPLPGSLHCCLLNGQLNLSYAASPDKPSAPRGGSLHCGLLNGHLNLSYATSLDTPSAPLMASPTTSSEDPTDAELQLKEVKKHFELQLKEQKEEFELKLKERQQSSIEELETLRRLLNQETHVKKKLEVQLKEAKERAAQDLLMEQQKVFKLQNQVNKSSQDANQVAACRAQVRDLMGQLRAKTSDMDRLRLEHEQVRTSNAHLGSQLQEATLKIHSLEQSGFWAMCTSACTQPRPQDHERLVAQGSRATGGASGGSAFPHAP